VILNTRPIADRVNLKLTQRSVWRLAALGDPRGLSDGALGHHMLGTVIVAVADFDTPLYNLLLDSNHAYWVVLVGATPLLQTISHAPERANGLGKAFLVHNRGG